MDEIKTSHRIGIPSIGLQSVRLPIIGNRSKQAGDGMLRDLKSHMLGWYDVKRQGCTNDSLAENPVLEDLCSKTNVNWNSFVKYTNRSLYTISSDGYSINITNVTSNNNLLEITSESTSPKGIVITVNGLPENAELRYRYEYISTSNLKEFIITKDGTYNLPYSNVPSVYNQGWKVTNFLGECNITVSQRKPYDLHLHNFEFGGLSGIGSYLNTITGLSNNDRFEGTLTKHSVTITRIIQTDIPNYVNIDTAKSKIIKFKVTGLPTDGFVVFHRDAAGNYKTKFSNGEHEVVINSNYILTAVGITGVPVNTETNIKIEVLPSLPNTLVFNGVAPTWVYDKSNMAPVTGISDYIDHKTLIIKSKSKQHCAAAEKVVGNPNEDLQIFIPSFKIRVSGITNIAERISFNITKYNGVSYSYATYFTVQRDGTYIVSEYNGIISAASETNIPHYILRIINNEYSSDNTNEYNIKIEFLPNYAAPTTKMYGDIPDIPLNAVKCMMMDFTPFADKKSTWYYSQRMNYNKEFVIASTSTIVGDLTDTSKIIAYQALNTLGTYINGIKNTDKTVLGLLQQRQVVSVNHASPNYKKIVIGRDDVLEDPNFVPQMALNSLILFDRELTREEMAYIIEKLMCEDLVTRKKYEMNMADTDPFTLYLDFSYQLPDDVTAYTGEIVGDHIRTHVIKGNIIPANTGVLVKTTTPGIKTFKEVYKAPSYIPANDLHGVTVDTPLTDLAGTNDQVLTLGVVDGVIGIRKPALSYIKANRCYVLVAYETPDDKNPETSGDADKEKKMN